MFNPPEPPRSKFSPAVIVLALFVIAAGAGIAYIFTTDKTPSWLSFLIPSSSFTPDAQEKAAAPVGGRNTVASGTENRGTPVRPPQRNTGSEQGDKIARPPSSAPEPSQPEAVPSSPATDEPGSTHPVVLYGKGKPAGPNAQVVRGEIPNGQNVSGIAPADAAKARGGQQTPAGPARQDNVVPFALLEDMAKFLTDNFWPQGSHPLAEERPVTTATVKWANIRYGSNPEGFRIGGSNPADKRRRAIDYIFTPATINSLYNAYAQAFFDAFDRQARSQVRGPEKKPLDSAQLGDMYDIYAVASQNLVEAMYAYMYTPAVRPLVEEYTAAASKAADLQKAFASGVQNASGANAEIARRFQQAILERDQKRSVLVSALQQKGAPQDMDADSLAYLCQWLYRRGANANDTITALANIIHSCALTFRSIGTQYDDMAYAQGLR